MGVVQQEEGGDTAAGCHEPAKALDGHTYQLVVGGREFSFPAPPVQTPPTGTQR